MTAAPVLTAPTSAETSRPPRERSGMAGARRSPLLTLGMLAFLVYFMLPLFWLFVASTKTTGDLFSSFGLWFADGFALPSNLRRLFTVQDGVYGRWLLNTFMYAVVSAGGAAVLAALGGYGFAKFRFPGNRLMFGLVLGAIMVPSTALAIPTYLLFSKVGLVDTPWAIILPSLVNPFGLYLMRVYARAGGAGRDHRGGAHRRRRRVPDLLAGRDAVARSRLRHGAAVHPGRHLEQLLPTVDHAE